MKIEYQSDIKNQYLILKPEKEGDNGYQTKMLMENKLDGLLPVHILTINCWEEYYYDISGLQSLEEYLTIHMLEAEELKGFMKGLEKLLEGMEEYLLEADKLYMKPEQVYVDKNSKILCFCYNPYTEEGFSEGLRKLFQYFLQKLDYQDKDGVNLAYKAYQKVSREGYTYDFFTELKKNSVHTQDTRAREPETVHLVKPQVMPEIIESEKEVPTDTRMTAAIMGIAGTGILTVLAVIAYRRLDIYGPTRDILLQCAGLLLTGVVLTGVLVKFGYGFLKKTKIVTREEVIPYDMQEEPDIEEEITRGDDFETVLLGYAANRREVYLEPAEGGYTRLYIDKYPFILGKRAEKADGIIPDDSISRMHAQIDREGENYYLTDLHSSNGTFLNDLQLNPGERTAIGPGDRIRLSRISYLFVSA